MFESPEKSLQERLPEALNRMMSFEEAANHESPVRVIVLKQGEHELTFFGSIHNNDPEDPMMEGIEKHLQESDPNLVLIEGRTGYEEPKPAKILEAQLSDQHANRETLIREHGEGSFTLRLASERGLLAASPEPADTVIAQDLIRQGISAEDIVGFYALRGLDAELRMGNPFPKIELINRDIDRQKERLGLQGIAYNFENLKDRLSELADIERNRLDNPGELTREEQERIFNLVDPVPHSGKPFAEFNKVSQKINRIRDEFMVKKLAQYLEKYKKVFIVYGASHLLMQERALRYLVEGQ